MKRSAALFALALGLVLVSCGGGSGTPHPSRVKRRAFVTNTFAGSVQIVNIDKDIGPLAQIPPPGNPFLLLNSPTFSVVTPDKSISVVFESTSNQVAVVDNVKESLRGSISIPNWTDSIVVSSDNKTGWAAVRNAVAANQPTTGAIAVLDIANGSVTSQIPVPLVHYLALNHAATKLLAFADESDLVYIVDLANKNAVTTAAGFDRPVGAMFSSDDKTAYVLSCGAECGGTAAKVTALDMTTGTPGTSVAVPGATVGLLDGGNLFVAGTPVPGSPAIGGCESPAQPGGCLSTVAISTMTLTGSVRIGDGRHGTMAKTGNGELYIGARTCTNNENEDPNNPTFSGCLSMYTPGAPKAAAPIPNCTRNPNAPALTCGDVTSIQPLTGRNVVYVIQGGELVIYDTTTNTPQATQIDFAGKCFDVKEVD